MSLVPLNGSAPAASRLRTVEQHQLDHASRRLIDEFHSSMPSTVVERVMAEVLEALLHEAKFTRYLPLLTERRSREQLRALPRVGDRPEIGS